MKKMDCLYEDKELLLVNKPAKLLTVGTEKIKEKTLYVKRKSTVGRNGWK